MADEPISFYVPARNVAATLGDCLDAIRAQTRPPDELFLVVDPRSSDETLPLARSLDVEVIEQQGQSLGAARNQAIRHAKHRWLASCDADVVIDAQWLERLAESRDTSAAGIGGATRERTLDECDAWRALHMPHHWGDHPFRNPFMLVSEVLFDTRALRAVGGYRDDLSYYEDSDLCQRLRDAGYDLLYQPAAKATHLRRDDLIGLLNLRWKYSEYRQKHLLERYAGLIEKMRVNREYAINTLSKTLARGREELTYISFALFFHHAVLDLRSCLSRRPLLDASARHGCELRLIKLLIETINASCPSLVMHVERDLRSLLSAQGEKAGTCDTLPPQWATYLQEAALRTSAFVDECGEQVRTIISASAAVIHDRADASSVPQLKPAGDLERAVASMPLTPCIDGNRLAGIRRVWPDAERFVVVGPVLPDEQRAIDASTSRHGTGAAALCPHLEADARPLERLAGLAESHERLAVCYRAPARFIPGLDVVSAGDLAAAATAAGWTIDRFETLVGRTQLLLSKSVSP